MQIQQNSASYNIPFLMLDSGDHNTPKTGLTPWVRISKNCGTFAVPSGGVAEIGLGWYFVSGHIQDTNTLGPLILRASGTGADMFDTLHEVVSHDPRNVNTSVADSVMTRQSTNWEASASGYTLGNVVMQSLNSVVNGNVLEIYKSTDTLLDTRALTKNSDNPIRAIQ